MIVSFPGPKKEFKGKGLGTIKAKCGTPLMRPD
jgi:hypothetical protein